MEIQTGILRQDIELIRPGAHGAYAMLFDPASESYFKISPHTAMIISRLDRSDTLEGFQERLGKAGIDVSLEELAGLIGFLQQNNLLAFEYGQYEKKREQIKKVKEDTLLLRIASAYMFFKLPPWHPNDFLKRIAPYVRFMSSRWFLMLLIVPAVIGYLLALRDFSAVRSTFLDSLSWAGLVKYFFAIVFLKVVHESSHMLAALHFGCRVRAVGVSFIVFYPRMFSDTTDSWRLPPRQRLLIDSGGVLGELLLGGLAALLWCYLAPGVFKSTMFYVFAVSSISSILVNGNPLIRYDGYYILCDLLHVENLMARSTEFVKQWWRYWFFRLGKPPEEKRWLLMLVFGVAAFLYKIVLYTSIIMIIYNSFVKAVAVVLLILEVYTIFLYPMYREFKTIQALSRKAEGRASWVFGTLACLIVAGVLFFPLSWNIVLPGEVRPEQHELVAVSESGYLTGKLSGDSRVVQRGDTLFALASPTIKFGIERLEAMLRQDELLFNMQQTDRENIGSSILTREKIRSDKLALDELKRRRDSLRAEAAFVGTFTPNNEWSQGAFLPQGLVVGELVAGRKMVHAYATDREVFKLSPGQEVEVLMTDRIGSLPGQITQINPIAAVLRNSPLLQHFGGEVPVYIDEKRSGEYLSVLPLYRVEIALAGEPEIQMGRTVRAKVLHREILAGEIIRYLVSAFRREF